MDQRLRENVFLAIRKIKAALEELEFVLDPEILRSQQTWKDNRNDDESDCLLETPVSICSTDNDEPKNENEILNTNEEERIAGVCNYSEHLDEFKTGITRIDDIKDSQEDSDGLSTRNTNDPNNNDFAITNEVQENQSASMPDYPNLEEIFKHGLGEFINYSYRLLYTGIAMGKESDSALLCLTKTKNVVVDSETSLLPSHFHQPDSSSSIHSNASSTTVHSCDVSLSQQLQQDQSNQPEDITVSSNLSIPFTTESKTEADAESQNHPTNHISTDTTAHVAVKRPADSTEMLEPTPKRQCISSSKQPTTEFHSPSSSSFNPDISANPLQVDLLPEKCELDDREMRPDPIESSDLSFAPSPFHPNIAANSFQYEQIHSPPERLNSHSTYELQFPTSTSSSTTVKTVRFQTSESSSSSKNRRATLISPRGRTRESRTLKGRPLPHQFLDQIVELSNTEMTESAIRDYIKNKGPQGLPLFFRFEQCSSAVRYRNANDEVDIYLQFNEDIMFGLLVIIATDSNMLLIDHLHDSMRNLDKKNIRKAAGRWFQKAENIHDSESQQRLLNAIKLALEFCEVNEITQNLPKIITRRRALASSGSNSSNGFPHPLVRPTPENLIRVLLTFVTREGFNKEHEIREYLKKMSPQPLPRCFRFEAERYVRYRNSREGLNLTLKLNEELIYGLLIATMIERLRTHQFDDLVDEIISLDTSPLVTVIEKFKKKSEILDDHIRNKVDEAIEATCSFLALSPATLNKIIPLSLSSEPLLIPPLDPTSSNDVYEFAEPFL